MDERQSASVLPTYPQHFVCHCSNIFVNKDLQTFLCTDARTDLRGSALRWCVDDGLCTAWGDHPAVASRACRADVRRRPRCDFARLDRTVLSQGRALRRLLMLNSKTLDDLAARIGQAIENSPAKDIEQERQGDAVVGPRAPRCRAAGRVRRPGAGAAEDAGKARALEARVAEIEKRLPAGKTRIARLTARGRGSPPRFSASTRRSIRRVGRCRANAPVVEAPRRRLRFASPNRPIGRR